MNLDEFRNLSAAPESAPLAALWHDARDEWDAAHAAVQNEDSAEAAWVHAYLHRKEGDISNARYWYARAGKPEFAGSLEDEWASLVQAIAN